MNDEDLNSCCTFGLKTNFIVTNVHVYMVVSMSTIKNTGIVIHILS